MNLEIKKKKNTNRTTRGRTAKFSIVSSPLYEVTKMLCESQLPQNDQPLRHLINSKFPTNRMQPTHCQILVFYKM